MLMSVRASLAYITLIGFIACAMACATNTPLDQPKASVASPALDVEAAPCTNAVPTRPVEPRPIPVLQRSHDTTLESIAFGPDYRVATLDSGALKILGFTHGGR